MHSTVFLNGEWLAAAAAKVSVYDRGFLFADGIYEVVPVYQRRPFLMADHLARMERSLAALNITAPGADYWQAVITELLARNQLDDALVYIQITRGAEANRSHIPTSAMSATLFASLSPLNVHWHQPAPLAVTLLDDIRWLRCDIKSISLLGNIMLKQQAHNSGFAEPLLQRDGYITEGASCNFFAVRDGVVYTAPKSHLILPGITRDHTLELARELGLEVREEAFAVADLAQLDELFLTSSSREVQPIDRIDAMIIGNGECGPVTAQLVAAYHASKRKLCEIS
ncbi:D-amino acid aminotransferase [Pseudidiomarina mangrovi]|uniref:D-amino acid aminotransferase n=1 Tax=Pseudidiomarina mangrovi TaxID=2487133 RepID=UPI000FCC7144|nr:D-amino acid aminotransferase [Pseudidiomarina mangrovi]CAI8153832.1 MAG: D-alanine aminotransferase [Pseudidiomarina mangrovi]